MKKKIGIFGSTGSIGITLLKVINTKSFEIIFITANKNYKKALHQAKIYKVKNIIITDKNNFNKACKLNKNRGIKLFNSFNDINQIIRYKLDYVMSAITGIEGLRPTFEIIKHTKKIAIANKETIICAWPLINKELVKNKTKFLPVDSEHMSLWSEIKNVDTNNIKKIYLTASGGPLLNKKIKNFKKIKLNQILKHPTWKMGKKISVDSATMMNKCFEVIEAKNIFNLKYNQIEIIIHPNSYVHALVSYKNGISKIVLHETTMKIPVFNSICSNNGLYRGLLKINFKKLNNLNFQNVLMKKYPIIKILKTLPNNYSLFETVIVSVNDALVEIFLKKKIHFNEIIVKFNKIISDKNLTKFKKKVPRSIDEIIDLNKKINLMIKKNI